MSLELYQEQLLQTQEALKTCDNEEDRANLCSLENDLKELISLESYESEGDDQNEKSSEEISDVENLEEDKKELYRHLINEKCRAPFHIKGHQEESFHNAFIADIISDDDEDGVIVQVFFLNPTHDKMKACDYFFEHRCTYEENCKYSHGEKVKYSRLKQFQPPNYKLLKRKSPVLVKTESLWKPASVLECSQKLKTCQVKLHNGNTFDCPFSDVLPPLETKSDDSSDLSTDEEDVEDFENFPARNVLQISDNFGEWEKHTTGIGSKILQKYGYVSGTGLGKKSEGITTPISARIYVQGKSLDYNMELNERKNQRTVEEHSRRESLKLQKINENYAKNEHQVFDFLNNTICNIKPSTSKSSAPKVEDVKAQSKAQLNIRNFKIEEDIKKVDISLKKLKQSQARHANDTALHKNLQRQINEHQSSLDHLQRSLHEVNKEQNSRRETSKLTIF